MAENYKCSCGNELTEDNVYYSNGCNEEGEDYSVYKFECENCKLSVDFSDWGECENPIEAYKKVQSYIVNINQK